MKWSPYSVYSLEQNHNKGEKYPTRCHVTVSETIKQYNNIEKFIQFIQVISQIYTVKS